MKGRGWLWYSCGYDGESRAQSPPPHRARLCAAGFCRLKSQREQAAVLLLSLTPVIQITRLYSNTRSRPRQLARRHIWKFWLMKPRASGVWENQFALPVSHRYCQLNTTPDLSSCLMRMHCRWLIAFQSWAKALPGMKTTKVTVSDMRHSNLALLVVK